MVWNDAIEPFGIEPNVQIKFFIDLYPIDGEIVVHLPFLSLRVTLLVDNVRS